MTALVILLASYAVLSTVWLAIALGGYTDLAREHRARRADNDDLRYRLAVADVELAIARRDLATALRHPSAAVVPFERRGRG